MGSNQILLIVLGVIVVGVGVTMGFAMFTNTSFNNNKQSTATEMQTYVLQLIHFWDTTVDLGGASSLINNVTVAKITIYLGFTGANNSLTSANGQFRVISVVTASPYATLTLKALGNSKKGSKYPLITTTIKFTESSSSDIRPIVTTTLGSAATF